MYYDEINQADIIDLRNSSKKVEDYNRLISREFNNLVAGTNRGKENEWDIIYAGTVKIDINDGNISRPIGTMAKLQVTPDVGNYGSTSFIDNSLIAFIKGNDGLWYKVGATSNDIHVNPILLGGCSSSNFTVGSSYQFIQAIKSTRTKSNTLLHCDIIGNPTNYPKLWKESGVFGTPLIVAEDGTSLLPDGAKDTFKLSRKANSAPLSVLRSKDNGLSWSDVSGETAVITLLSTGGNIYAGTTPSGKIFKSDNGTDWKMVLDSSETSIKKIIKHSDGNFYAATTPSGKILKSTDGNTWETVLDSTETAIVTLFSHTDGYVYAGTNPSGRIYRSNNGVAWETVLDTTETHILSIISHTDGYLYAGTGASGKIFRSNNGVDWNEVSDLTETEIFTLVSFGSYLYAGTSASGKIFRSNDGGTTWNEVYDTAGTHVLSFMVHTDGYLYAGTNDSGKIYRSNDGTTWSLAVDTTETHIYSLTSHTDGYIYAGTYPLGKIYRSNDGTTWNEVLKPYSFNTTLNEITLTDEPTANLVMVYYQTHTSMAVPVANSEVLETGAVFATNYSTITDSLINKVPTNVGGGTGNIPLQFLGKPTNYGIANSSRAMSTTEGYRDIPQNKAISLTASMSPSVKVFPYLTRTNGKAYLNLVFKEMKYNTIAGQWGDDTKFNIVDNVSTTTDFYGETVLIGQKTVELPYFINAGE